MDEKLGNSRPAQRSPMANGNMGSHGLQLLGLGLVTLHTRSVRDHADDVMRAGAFVYSVPKYLPR